jgi:hypothetical protein
MTTHHYRHPRWKILLFGTLTGLLLTGRMGAIALRHGQSHPSPKPLTTELPT